MRIGSTILLKDEKCYQSYNWEVFRPLGSLQVALDSLDEYECDEVAIIRPVRDSDSLDLFSKDLDVLRRIKTSTPISFGGGIRSIEHLNLLEGLPIERLIFSSSFIENNISLVGSASELLGKQAIQCLLPVKREADVTHIYRSDRTKFLGLDEIDLNIIDELANEVVLYDIKNDGLHDSFDVSILDSFSFLRSKLVITGGVGKSTIDWARVQGLASVLIDNKVLHHEYSIRSCKRVS